MPSGAPLRVTVEVHIHEGQAAGQRRFRLSRRIELPPALVFEVDFPVEGSSRGDVAFHLPDGTAVQSGAVLRYDPEHPEQGSRAELTQLDPTSLQNLESYIKQRLQQ